MPKALAPDLLHAPGILGIGRAMGSRRGGALHKLLLLLLVVASATLGVSMALLCRLSCVFT